MKLSSSRRHRVRILGVALAVALGPLFSSSASATVVEGDLLAEPSASPTTEVQISSASAVASATLGQDGGLASDSADPADAMVAVNLCDYVEPCEVDLPCRDGCEVPPVPGPCDIISPCQVPIPCEDGCEVPPVPGPCDIVSPCQVPVPCEDGCELPPVPCVDTSCEVPPVPGPCDIVSPCQVPIPCEDGCELPPVPNPCASGCELPPVPCLDTSCELPPVPNPCASGCELPPVPCLDTTCETPPVPCLDTTCELPPVPAVPTELGIDVDAIGSLAAGAGAGVSRQNGATSTELPYLSFEAANGDEDSGNESVQVENRTMGCTASGGTDRTTDWTEDPYPSAFANGPISGSYYVIRYGKLNASRKSTGEMRYHVLGCVFGNGRTTEGRLRRIGAGYVAYNAASPSSPRFQAPPVWDTDLSDERAQTVYDIKATVKNVTVGVGVPVSSKVGHLDGNFGARGPQDVAVDNLSIVNTTHAWWQNDCRGGFRCGVTTTRGSVLEATHGFGMDTEPVYHFGIQSFGQYRK